MLDVVLDVANRCASEVDLAPGSRGELELLEYVANIVDSRYVSLRFIEVPVVMWTSRYARVYVDGRGYFALAMPPTPGGWVRGILTDNPHDADGKILMVNYPEKVSDAEKVYVEAIRSGASAVIFVDNYPGVVRRMVMVTNLDYTRHPASPPPILAVSVSMDVGWMLRKNIGNVVELFSDADISIATGYSLEAAIYGTEDHILLATHHDHWLRGYADNCLGLGASVGLFRDITRVGGLRRGVRFISFTAEEFGDPGFPSLYWAHGSAKYANSLAAKGSLDDIYTVLNLDMIGRGHTIYCSKDLRNQLGGLAKGARWADPLPDFDSVNFENLGVSTVSVSSIEQYYDVYHTTSDDEAHFSTISLIEALNDSERIMMHLIKEDPKVPVLTHDVREELGIPNIGFREYRLVKRLISGFYAVHRRSGDVDIVYIDSIIGFLRDLARHRLEDAPLKVSRLGTGEVVYDASEIRDQSQWVRYLSGVEASILEDINITLRR